MSALMATGYMTQLIGITCLVVALLCFSGRTALAAVLLAPLSVNIILFHIFLDAVPIGPSSALGYLLLVLNLFFLWYERGKYRALLR